MYTIIKAECPNSDEIDHWNGAPGQNWTDQNRLTDLMYDQFGAQVLAQAALKAGDKVLDVGCGCGTTTLKIAKSVAPDGLVTAVDVSAVMLNVDREQVKSAAAPVNILNADAKTYLSDPASFDVVFSQFGVMFFANPETAFANFYRSLKPGGRLAFVCWRGPGLSPWLMVPYGAVRSFMPDMPTPSPETPASPFSLESKPKTQAMLTGAGFVDVRLDPLDTKVRMGDGNIADFAAFVAAFNGQVSAILRKVGAPTADAVMAALTDGLSEYHKGDRPKFPASAWIVSARKP